MLYTPSRSDSISKVAFRKGAVLARLPASRNQATLARKVQACVAQSIDSETFTSANQSLANSPGGCPRISDCGANYFSEEDSRPVILFDGVCNLCNAGVQFVLDWDKDAAYRFASLQSEAGKALLQRSGRAPDDISSIVLVSKNRHWIKSTAVLKIAEELKAPVPIVSAMLQPMPGFLRDQFYNFVSENRYAIFGESNQCRMMLPEWRLRFLN